MFSIFRTTIFAIATIFSLNAATTTTSTSGHSATTPIDLVTLIEDMAPGVRASIEGTGKICVTGDTQKFTSLMNNKDNAFQRLFPCASAIDLSSIKLNPKSFEEFMGKLQLGTFWKRFEQTLSLVTEGGASPWEEGNESFTVNATGPSASLMFQGFLEHLKGNTLFNWLMCNVQGFLKSETTEKGTSATINYGLASEIFRFNPEKHVKVAQPSTTVVEGDEEGAPTPDVTFSTEEFLKRLVLLNHGRVMLQPTGVDGEYKVHIIQTHNAPPQEFDLVVLVDVSGSMAGQHIAVVKEKLPEFLRTFCSQLNPTQKVNLKVVYFGDEENDTHEQSIGQKDQNSTFSDVQTKTVIKGTTDLTVFEKYIWGKDGLLVGFTDGGHSCGEEKLTAAFDSMQTGVSTKSFREPFVFPVGASADEDFFKKISGIFAGCTHKVDDMDGFFDMLRQKLPQITQGSEAFQLIQALRGSCITLRVPRAQGIYATGHTALEGDSVRDTGTGHTVTARKTFVDAATGMDMDDALSTKSGEDIGANPSTQPKYVDPHAGGTVETAPVSVSKSATAAPLTPYVWGTNYRIVKIGDEEQFEYKHQVKDSITGKWQTLDEAVSSRRTKKTKALPARNLRLGKNGVWYDALNLRFVGE